MEKIKPQYLVKHKNKRKILLRFFLLMMILLIYFIFIAYKYGLKDGASVLLITWSAFVLSTPIADAGFILDFPIRLLFNIKMFFSEMIVWSIAILSNTAFIFLKPDIYNSTFLTKLFKEILVHPFPYWAIIFLSALGTFLSVIFGDELLEVIRHKDRKMFHKHKFKAKAILVLTVFIAIIIFYDILGKKLGINLELIK